MDQDVDSIDSIILPVSNSNGDDTVIYPSINERLGYLRPSKELLEFYRKKIADYDIENEKFNLKLDELQFKLSEQQKNDFELRQKNDEISELQKALSDMQIYLFQEREHVLKLYAENDRLKIQQLEDKRKIQHLLTFCGKTEGEITFFLKDPPNKQMVSPKIPQKLNGKLKTGYISNKIRQDTKNSSKECDGKAQLFFGNEILQNQLKALQIQLEQKTQLSKEQSEAFLEDRRIKQEEFDAQRKRDSIKINDLLLKINKSQELICSTTKDFIGLRKNYRTKEKNWMNEKDRLLQQLDSCKQQYDIKYQIKHSVAIPSGCHPEVEATLNKEIEEMTTQCEQANKLAAMYRGQVISLEEHVSVYKEESDMTRTMFQSKTENVQKKLKIMTSRYNELEKRRNLEVEGFQNDIKSLKTKLRNMERQLYKVTIGLTENTVELPTEKVDMQILRNVMASTTRSKELMKNLVEMKGKIYQLEKEVRHL